MTDIKVTDNYDVAIEYGDIALIEGKDAVLQDLLLTSQAWLGDNKYDLSLGIAYEEVIFQRGVQPFIVDQTLEDAWSERPNVISATCVSTIQNRRVFAEGNVDAAFGSFTFSVEVQQ